MSAKWRGNEVEVALIIQGPLISNGITGADNFLKKAQINSHIDFDCRPNIRRLIVMYEDLFSAIVVSTWDDDTSFEHQSAHVLRIPPLDTRQANSDLNLGNILRQFTLIRAGLDCVPRTTDYVLKIRTDQFLRLDILVRHIKGQADSGKWFTPDFYLDGKFHDFYLAGPQSEFASLASGICDAKSRYTRSVHHEIPILLAGMHPRLRHVLRLAKHSEYGLRIVRVLAALLLNRPFPHSILYGGIIWRGELHTLPVPWRLHRLRTIRVTAKVYGLLRAVFPLAPPKARSPHRSQ